MELFPHNLTVAGLLSGLAVFSIVSCSGAPVKPADLVLRGGKIATVDSVFFFAEAVAVSGDRIVKVGKSSEMKPYIGPGTQVIELDGKLVVPGLIDAHAHLPGYAEALAELDLRGTNLFQEIVDMVAKKAKTTLPGEWILGRSWDQNDWDSKEMPSHELLTKAVPNNPVWLVRVDGHAGIANKKAMEMCGITTQTPNLPGGEILRRKDGAPTGVFIDHAMHLVYSRIPDIPPERERKNLAAAAKNCLAAGLTGIHDAGVSPVTVEHYKYLIDHDRMGLRIYAMLSDPGVDDLAGFMKKNLLPDYGGHCLTVRSIKLFIDGTLGSRGAALLEPYSDRPGYSGLLTASFERVEKVSESALAAGFQVCTHAIGDRGNRLALDAYEQAFRAHPTPDHRFRIEHAQVVSPEDIPRFAALGVIPSMQPTHATSDMYWAQDRLGPERIEGAYVWQKFLKTGAFIPCGSDFPVEEINPMLGIYAAITRKDPKGWPTNGWFPEERMTREQALRGFTIWAAYAAFQEKLLGSIEAGKLADMVVLSRDILTVAPKEILTTVPEYTIVGGKVRYQRK
ncbi:MAG: amidohydrolase [Candidatus Latescibacter sp.]|nr:amidohydrolase [Candidatus Latescibacter sp.]